MYSVRTLCSDDLALLEMEAALPPKASIASLSQAFISYCASMGLKYCVLSAWYLAHS